MERSVIPLFIKLAYLFATFFLAPIIYLRLRLRKALPPYGKDAKQLLGFIPLKDYGHPIWFHTVSVGESMGAIPLIKEFAKKYPSQKIVVTTSTTTSKELYKPLSNLVTHLFAPLDSYCAVNRFIKRLRPKALIVMETELWPNLLTTLDKQDIPVFIINARLSDRSAKRYLMLSNSFYKLIGSHLKMVLCQTAADESNFLKLGLTTHQTAITGSLKYDVKMDKTKVDQGELLKKSIGTRPIYIAASTHVGEDEIILNQFRTVLKALPNTLLIIVPRHPERFNAVSNLAKSLGFITARRSLSDFNTSTNVLIGDSMGELQMYLSMADVVFMSGSLTNIGGHNPLEAIAVGKPVVTGKIIFNFKKMYEELTKNEACIIAETEDIPHEIISLLSDSNKRKLISTNASKILNNNLGSINKTLNILESNLKL